jgi:peptidoglycan hydrolase-like protein with peptidoglycan-binding domain
MDFQLRNSLAPTGIADRTTWDLLYSQYVEIINTSSLPDPIIPFPSYPKGYTIKPREKSFLVATIQFMLNEIGSVYNTFEAIEINGEYDSATESIIKDFQSRNFLQPTGEVDRKTWSALARIYNLTLHYIDQY